MKKNNVRRMEVIAMETAIANGWVNCDNFNNIEECIETARNIDELTTNTLTVQGEQTEVVWWTPISEDTDKGVMVYLNNNGEVVTIDSEDEEYKEIVEKNF